MRSFKDSLKRGSNISWSIKIMQSHVSLFFIYSFNRHKVLNYSAVDKRYNIAPKDEIGCG